MPDALAYALRYDGNRRVYHADPTKLVMTACMKPTTGHQVCAAIHTVTWTLALLWEVKRRRTSALPDVAGGVWAFRRFVRVRAKSDNRPAIGSGSPPPRPTASA